MRPSKKVDKNAKAKMAAAQNELRSGQASHWGAHKGHGAGCNLLSNVCVPSAMPRPSVDPVRNSPMRSTQRARPPPTIPSTRDMMALSATEADGTAEWVSG